MFTNIFVHLQREVISINFKNKETEWIDQFSLLKSPRDLNIADFFIKK